MKQNRKVKNVIRFYSVANRLKETFDNNVKRYNDGRRQSYAEQTFGSCILAVGADSEFDLDIDLDTSLWMLLIHNLSKIFVDDASLIGVSEEHKKQIELNAFARACGKMKAKERLTAIYSEYLDGKTNEAIFAKCCDMVENTFEEKREHFMNYQNVFQAGKIENIIKLYDTATLLKTKRRSGWDEKHWNVAKDRTESVAEHSVLVCLLAIAVATEFDLDVDLKRTVKMLLLHDMGEANTADNTPFENVSKDVQHEIDVNANIEIYSGLRKGKLYINLFIEFEARTSKKSTVESRLAFHIDKIEDDFQAKIYQDMGCQHDLEHQENNVVLNSPIVQQMLKNGAKLSFDIWFLWDKKYYVDDKIFADMLLYVRNHNIYRIAT